MGQYVDPPDLLRTIGELKKRVQSLEISQTVRTYTLSTRPPAVNLTGGVIIYVSDAASGQRFQGWDQTANAWVPLG